MVLSGSGILLSVLECLVFVWFLKPLRDSAGGADRHARWSDILLIGAVLVCLYIFQRGATAFSMPLYGQLAGKWITAVLFSCLWCRSGILRGFCYGTLFFLMSDSADILFSFFSQKLIGSDLFMSADAAGRAAYCLALALVLLLYAGAPRSFLRRSTNVKLTPLFIVITTFSLIPYLFIRGIVEWLPLSNEDLSGEIPVMLIVTSAICLMTTIGTVSMLSAQQALFESQKMRHILEMQYQNALQQKEMTDLVNRRYHDMKQILVYLEGHAGDARGQAHMDALLHQLAPVESMISTGEPAVDLILGQKLALCGAQHVRCLPQVDGTLLSFLDPMDICTLFGNAMDNAIEACEQLPEEERRIQVRTNRQGEMLLVRFVNPAAAAPEEVEGTGEAVLRTSKEQRELHGYGIRNMREVMKKYGGQLRYDYRNGEFTLDLFFPSQGAA